ncbi:hypothetical protein M378DRAFT_71041 [Amanita muscaria Koide BX008]|uniref:N(6)-L-threonylcarbamoyladenine synthase n=1 Tax=Amanita muscaria (strain Koide BX008) TaxID=946122 RepID=A0A0C2XHK5_AMAMK|nr:hypothetical protein M378DRAFT_71041 [Amanita muscaria Koide BX008]
MLRSRLLHNSAPQGFIVLALESSADDTCAAVVTSSRQILSNVVIKQNQLQVAYGGIHPSVAIEAHQRNMPLAVQQALKNANVDLVRDIDGIAFTRGPGIGGCLSVGSNAAKSLAAALNKPLVGVHHMQGHALTPLLTTWPNPPEFPFLSLLISGGHTLLLLAKSPISYKILGTTLDESIGRSFDKVSRLLGLKWGTNGPGAALEEFCALDKSSDTVPGQIPPFPRPMHGRLAFSYASFHSHVERYIFSRGGIDKINHATKQALARGFQEAAVLHLKEKLSLGINWCQKQGIEIKNIVVSGGVASNQHLRNRCKSLTAQSEGSNSAIFFIYPPPHLCTDNAVMIGWASMGRFLAGSHDDYTIDLRPKWSIEDLHTST